MSKKRNALYGLLGFLTVFTFFLFICLLSSSELIYSISVVTCFFMGLGSLFALSQFIRETKLELLPILSSSAVLIEKIKEDHRGSSDYFLNFELDNGERKLFKVNRETYAKYLQNEKGIITYKEKDNLVEFLSFEKESNN